MIKVELHTGEILIVAGISSDPLENGKFLLQYPAYVEEIDFKTIKHISAC